MKRLILPSLVIVGMLALFMWGTRLVERTLDAELPKLLSRELGIPVYLAPVQARLRNLAVRSPKLVMGDPADPAIVATDVTVSLDWSDVLNRQLRLRRVSAADLMVKPSQWPGNDNPLPTDYNFLDPFLPDQLALTSGRYIYGDGDSHPVANVQWQRQSPGASLNWRENLDGQPVDISVRLASLVELLRLARVELQVKTIAGTDMDSQIDTRIELQPGETSGYRLTARIEAAGMSAQVQTGSATPWALPESSDTRLQLLDLGKLQGLVRGYSQAPGDDTPETLLATRLPRLSLPKHRGHVTIDELRWRDEVTTDNGFDFTAGPEGVAVQKLSSTGPAGILHAEADITSSANGWQLGLKANLTAAEADQSLAAPYLAADWLWHSGRTEVSGRGTTWGGLLNSLEGDITLAGAHRGAADTPVTLKARLDNRPGEFALDLIDIELGGGRITGSAILSHSERYRLSGVIKVAQVNLDDLLPASGEKSEAGIPIPEFFEALPGVDLDWNVDIDGLVLPGADLDQVTVMLTRTPRSSSFTASATGRQGGTLNLAIDAAITPNQPSEVRLQAKLSQIDIPKVFRQEKTLFHYRASGTIDFNSKGNGVDQIFQRMQGNADLVIDMRRGQAWQGTTAEDEQVRVSGKAKLVISDQRIAGMEISELAVTSLQQNLTGTVSMVDGRKPWMIATLESDNLDIPTIMTFKEAAPEDSPGDDPLTLLKNLGAMQISLNAKSLQVSTLAMTDVSLQVNAAPGSIAVDRLDFSLGSGGVTSRGAIRWHENEASLSLGLNVSDLDLEKFLEETPGIDTVPVSGTVNLQGAGGTLPRLLADLTGEIELQSSAAGSGGAAPAARVVSVTAARTEDGIRAVIHRLQWDETDLRGSIRYHRTTPPLFEVELVGGTLSLLPWETAEPDANAETAKKAGKYTVAETARASADLVGEIVSAPLRLLSGPREAEPGEKLFNADPLALDWLKRYQVTLTGKLDSLASHEVNARDLLFSASLLDGKLSAEATAGTFNQGSGSVKLTLDSTENPASVAASGTFRDLRALMTKTSYSRSGYFDLNSRGASQAELAGNLNGVAYLELGKGPLDYSRMMLLTADVAINIFQTLIPRVDKEQPELECGITLGVFNDGIGTTPYGYAARTNQANLVGRVEVDLKKELIHLNFSSSSRQGMGFSIGNVFSNTVEVEGPLTDPKIVPDATGLLWRSWAAVVTGGLSVVGESVLKRALASENPCTSVQNQIRKDLCKTDQPAANSPLVCPSA